MIKKTITSVTCYIVPHKTYTPSCYLCCFYFLPRKRKVEFISKTEFLGNSLAVQRLGLGTFNAEDPGSTPGQGTKILQAMLHGQKTKRKQRTNKQKNTEFLGIKKGEGLEYHTQNEE